MPKPLTPRPFVAAGILVILLVVILLAPRLGLPQEPTNLILGAAIAWGGAVVQFYFRKKETG